MEAVGRGGRTRKRRDIGGLWLWLWWGVVVVVANRRGANGIANKLAFGGGGGDDGFTRNGGGGCGVDDGAALFLCARYFR